MRYLSKRSFVPCLLVAIAAWSLPSADASGTQARKSLRSGAKAGSPTENAPSDDGPLTLSGQSFGSSGGSSGSSSGGSSSGSSHSSGKSFSSGSNDSSSSFNRSASFSENGRKVTINENSRSGITVKITETVDGKPKTKVVQAANAADLAKKDPAAYDLYKRHLAGKTSVSVSAKSGGSSSGSAIGGSRSSGSAASSSDGRSSKSSSKRSSSRKSGSSASGGAAGGSAAGGDARDLLRQQIRQMKKEHADDPAVTRMLDESLEQLDKN